MGEESQVQGTPATEPAGGIDGKVDSSAPAAGTADPALDGHGERLIDVELKRSAVGGTRQSLGYTAAMAALLLPTALVAVLAFILLAFIGREIANSLAPEDPYTREVLVMVYSVLIWLAIVAAVIAAYRHRVSAVKRWRRAGGDPQSSESVAGFVRHMLENRWVTLPATNLRKLLQALVAADQQHLIVRARAEGEPLCTEPLNTIFAPLPLSEREAALRQLLETGTPDANAARAAADRKRKKRRALAQGLAMAMGLVWVAIAFAQVVTGRGFGASMIRLAPVVIASTFLSLIISRRNRRNEWFLVPGGAVLRHSGLFDSRWKLHVLDRRRSVLLLIQDATDRWLVLAGDVQHRVHRYCTTTETEALLRAWRAPFEPPPVEQLTDLV